MGNCWGRCCGEDSGSEYDISYTGHYSGQHGTQGRGYCPPPQPPPPQPSTFTYHVVGFTAVARDLQEFEATHKVPIALKEYVTASKATQIIWYEKLLASWKRAKPAPATAEEVADFIVQTLQGYHNFQGLLDFYHLHWPKTRKPTGTPEPRPKPTGKPEPTGRPAPVVIVSEAGGKWPQAVKYEIHTLPVDGRDVGDGDGFTAFVDVHKDEREKQNLPQEIQDAVKRRRDAKAKRDNNTAAALQKQIEEADYKVFDGKDGKAQCLARKYRIRLKGVDAPEIGQSYGEESKKKLNKLVKGHRLLIHVYGIDRYGRALGDVHRNGIFIQEALLKEGFVWHYKDYDKRKDFAQWERDAKAARLGLWADDDPEKPWDWRKKHRRLKKGPSIRKRGG